LAARTAQTMVRGTDLELAIQRVLGGAEKRSTAVSPEERQMVAYHEAGHAITSWMLPYTDLLLKVGIEINLILIFKKIEGTQQNSVINSLRSLF